MRSFKKMTSLTLKLYQNIFFCIFFRLCVDNFIRLAAFSALKVKLMDFPAIISFSDLVNSL